MLFRSKRRKGPEPSPRTLALETYCTQRKKTPPKRVEPPQEEQKHAGPVKKAVPFTQGQAGGARTHARGTGAQDGGQRGVFTRVTWKYFVHGARSGGVSLETLCTTSRHLYV